MYLLPTMPHKNVKELGQAISFQPYKEKKLPYKRGRLYAYQSTRICRR
ncbi:hypothetical protein J2Z48_002080 [Croceifilum oryzae]|uniref:Uncharacterized protein n=1 Tax=Croceifilum oryzae TaxID=1553429 RepID=A0AAJ1WUD7_9BACL|nr:hypothetical protein [Croceifilum oryzae]